MSILGRLQNLSTWPPPQVGSEAHPVSLTADEGTWVKLLDFRDHLNVVFVVFNSITDPDTDTWLQSWSQHLQQFESLNTAVFGVNTARTDELRRYRQRLGLEFFILYDPLAVESRAMRCSSRVAPVCKTTVLAIAKNGKVMFGEMGMVDPLKVVELIARSEGVSTDDLAPTVTTVEKTKTTNKPGAGPAVVHTIDSEQAETYLHENDGGYVLIDVRTKSEYDADHSPHAVHIPIDELPHRYRELKQTTRILCVCQAGGRSAAAAEFLTSIGGTEIYNVEGGMSAWAGERVTGGELQP
jgi:rhodanese-related sulfurtransferase/peroxiredoxin